MIGSSKAPGSKFAWRAWRALTPGLGVLVCLCILAGPSSAAQAKSARPQAETQAAPADPATTLSREERQTRDELKNLTDAITLSKDRVAKLQADIAGLAKDQVTLRQQLVDAATRQKDLEREIDRDERRLTALHGQANRIHANLMAHRDVLAQVLAALERMGRNPPPALLVKPNDALSAVRSAILLGAVIPQMRQQTLHLARQLDDLKTVREAIAGKKAQIAAALGDVATEKKRLSLLLDKKKLLQAKSRTRLAAEQQRSSDLADKAGNLQDLIASLEDRITSVRKAAEEARRAEEKRMQETAEQLKQARERAAAGLPDKNRIAPAYAFSDLKHALDLPVAGDPVKWFGDDDGTGNPLQGMMVSAPPGALVTAPADGWVVYAGPFRSYGDLLILNVGDGYHVVLAGMSRMDVAQGQFVVAGEPVAEMGKTRLAGAAALALVSAKPTLYIEFRKGAKPVDPRPWWADNFSGRVSNGT